jgi:glycosyltransferase involved in cell wall biosynthesis
MSHGYQQVTKKLSICYAAPGHTLVSTAGSARNILAAANALSDYGDVTVAFRSISEPVTGTSFTTREIFPATTANQPAKDDVAARGLNPLAHLADLRTLKAFADTACDQYDLILEKGWRLSGYLSNLALQRGTPAMLIENDARYWCGPRNSLRAIARFSLHLAAQRVAARCSRKVPVVVAETEQLKRALIDARGLQPDRVHVVTLGVDHNRFKPQDQREARRSLGINVDALVLLYVGGMDQYHDLSPLLEALIETQPPHCQVHLVGDGEYRERYHQLGERAGGIVKFHGNVPHAMVPTYIASADVCLAPYQTGGFLDGEVSFSTLKIPEYMACGRAVISVPSGHILSLIDDNKTGFLFNNEISEWLDFLARMPTRQYLSDMGTAAAPSVARLNWDATASTYLALAREEFGFE